MDIRLLDKALVALVEKKNQLSELSYADKNYDVIEEELHDMEDDFVDEYGEFLEDILTDVHDDICPDSDVLLPTAYLANKYTRQEIDKQIVYFPADGGVIVDVDKYPNKLTRLVLVPAPTRLILQISKDQEEVVWNSQTSSTA